MVAAWLSVRFYWLKANPDRNAVGTVIGPHYGRVKAMTDHRGKKMKSAGPATPVQVLGLTGAPQAGDKIQVMETEREARELATQRQHTPRALPTRNKMYITLDEICCRLTIGSFLFAESQSRP